MTKPRLTGHASYCPVAKAVDATIDMCGCGIADQPDDPRIRVVQQALDDYMISRAIDWWPDTDKWAEEIVRALDEET